MQHGKVTRPGEWTEIPKATKAAVHRRRCCLCGKDYGYISGSVLLREHIEHIFPRRWLAEKFPDFNPHDARNLLSACNVCHGRKKVLEDALYRGDLFEFLKGLRVLNYPMESVWILARLIGIVEVEGWQL